MYGYRADTAFDGERGLTGGALVLVDGGVIVGVEPASAAAPDGCEITHLPGTTLLPGLIDAHVHLCADNGPNALDRIPDLTPDELHDVIRGSMRRQLRHGVTAVRDLGDHHFTVVDHYRGRGDGPTVVVAGPPITSPGGHCASMGGEARGADELRRAVRDRADRGADVVKIMTSGGVMTPGTDVLACQFTQTELRVVVDEAHRLGLPVTAHAHGVPAVRQSITAGVDGIEHCSCMTGKGFDTPPDVAAALAARGTVVCPTLGRDLSNTGGVIPPQIKAMLERTGMTFELRLAQVGQLYRAGVTLISGGDSGINPGKPHGMLPFSIADLVECGAPAETALASATSAAADGCGLSGHTGRLRAGLDADLLIVDGDPTTDIAALHRIRVVVSRGREVDTSS